jgi:hypothetical protein
MPVDLWMLGKSSRIPRILSRRELYQADDARGTTKVVRLEQLQPSTHLLGKKITNIWKGRDHTTVMYAVKKLRRSSQTGYRYKSNPKRNPDDRPKP